MLLSLPALHLQTSKHHPLFQLPHGRLGPWCNPTGSPAPLSCETGCGVGSWILVCRLLVPTQVSLLSMEEDIDTRKINNSFLRDHSYATEADIISTVEFNHTGELLATGDKGGRVVIFQREQEVLVEEQTPDVVLGSILRVLKFSLPSLQSKNQVHRRGEYNVYSTFQSHEPEFDYLKSLEIEEKINKIRWLPQQNAAYFLLSTNDKTVKLWKVSERDKRPEGYNLKDEEGRLRDPATITTLRVPVLRPMDLMVEATPRRVFANAHTYHINSISVNSDYETYMSADDLRINLWNFEITNQSFNIVDIKPANMEELTEVITAAEFHPHHCNTFVYSSSKGTIRLCDMRASALCDRHTKFFEEPEDPSNRSFFSEIISSISDVKFSHSGRYIMTRDYLTVKVWDLNMENRPIETYQVHDYLRSKLCSLYENDCIFDKFECVWNGSDSVIMTGSYNNFFRMFDRNTKRDVTLEASRENSKPRAILKPRKVCVGGKRRKDEISVDSLDFSKKILHTAWHPSENIIAVAATNNLYIFQDKVN
ncbi:serine/threonine-protein phosphatase 2A 55 kDa regulatory subunit B beta isoform isoform X1 [Mesocricetus auratus]|uniref:Serine/threonine-protein phosphatase 2A 55 kDa regulatory subunit B n=2 Tax=Mesocricetus auratus TaxID=10036 RepID=A0ABM2X4S1_MESAU|nr:serine/threonine-protein phosphatase 2A 55 kDa regulatory subunit B beta isoform isoform X1 [Mesocricetus auratus]